MSIYFSVIDAKDSNTMVPQEVQNGTRCVYVLLLLSASGVSWCYVNVSMPAKGVYKHAAQD